MSKEERIDYLEGERVKIWARLTYLEGLVEKKTSDYEAEAKLAAEQATTFKDTSKISNDEIAVSLEEVRTKLKELRGDYSSFEKMFVEIKSNAETSTANNGLIQTIYANLVTQSETVDAQITEIKKIFDSKPQLDESLKKLETIFKNGDDYDLKISTLYKSITERRKEIDGLYYEIIGFIDKDAEGKEIEVKGLKDELEESYTLLKTNFSETEKKLIELEAKEIKSYNDFSSERKNEFSELTGRWKKEYDGVLKRIETLLPHALTTGLSYAYSEKKGAEEEDSKKHSTSFKYAIWGMVAVSLIPFSVSVYSLLQNEDLEAVIIRIPRIVLAILPLYLPVLWVAYSANRKMNLAKRLIEEYSHKEVLSKTFEGLSKQINSIEDKDISNDLKIKLLYNILEVNSENPGKLISDYNKSDHPLMDALEKSVKLSNAVTRLSKIPGFSKLASALEKKSQEILKEEGRKAVAGLDTVIADNEKA